MFTENTPTSANKILAYPSHLSSTTDGDGDKHYMIIKINTPTRGTRLKDDSSSGDVYVNDQRLGIGVGASARGAFLTASKNVDPDLVRQYGENAVNSQSWNIQKGMSRVDKAIVLPMPDDLAYSTRIGYDSVTSTPLTVLGDTANQGAGGVIGSNIDKFKNRAIASMMNSLGAGNITNERSLNAEDKIATNPRKEVLYQDFDRRSFQFRFAMQPISAKESETVRDIVETMRYYSLPEIQPSKMFYILPAEFEITFMIGDKINPNIPKIATCVCTDVSVNYSPMGVWATLPDGSPVATVMNLSFKEMELIDRTRIHTLGKPLISGY